MAIDINTLLLRILADPNYSAKGSPLTWTELDTNLKVIADNIKALMIPSIDGFEAYDNGATYSSGQFVSYNNNIYEYINALPQSGITPGTDPSTWEIVSIGEFAHQQNTDQYLDFGGAKQVSAEDIYNFINAGPPPPPSGDHYFTGSESTDDSVRLHYDIPTKQLLAQIRVSGTWTNGTVVCEFP